MIRINLVPKEIEKKAKAKEKIILLGLAGVLILAIFFGLWFWKIAQVKRLEAHIKKLDNELKSLESQARKVDEIERNKTALNQRLSVINTLLTSRLDYPKLMEKLTMPEIIPPRVWITSLLTKYLQDSIELNFQVQAMDNYAIADFLSNLAKNKYFDKVELNAITTTKIEDVSVRTFSIKCIYKPERGKKNA